MRIVIAPDSFKESLTSLEVADAIAEGFSHVIPALSIQKIPLADGGEGTTEALLAARGGKRISCTTCDALGRPIHSFFGDLGAKQAVLEVAEASGLMRLTPKERNPGKTSSYGTGLLLRAALDYGAEHILIGLGGSATNDAGVGLLSALGARFLDADEQEISPDGEGLGALRRIDLTNFDPRIANVRIEVASDVDNPLCGPEGASLVFGRQKGGSEEQLRRLDSHFARFAELTKDLFGQDYAAAPGSGAAGGLGWALRTFCHASLRPGIDIVAEAVGLRQAIEACDLVITGEGRLDGQTLRGKTPVGVAAIAKEYKKPVLAIGGSVAKGCEALFDAGIDAIESSVARPSTLDECLKNAKAAVRDAASRAARLLLLGKKLGH